MNSLHAAWIVAKKDLLLALRDRTGLLLGFLLPIVLVGAFGFIFKVSFGQDGGGMDRATLWVADEDGTDASRAFVAALRDAATIRLRPEPGDEPATADALRTKVEAGDAHHALIVEKGFAEALTAERFPPLSMLRDPDRQVESQMISIGVMSAFFASQGPGLSHLFTARALELAGLPPEWHDRVVAISKTFSTTIGGLFDEKDRAATDGTTTASDAKDGPDFGSMFSQLVPMTTTDVRPSGRPQISYWMAQTVCGNAIMMLMFGLVACGQTLLREREDGTLSRLLTSRLPRSSILWGKALMAALMGAAQLFVVFAFGSLVFQVNFLADPSTLFVVSAATIFAITGFGIVVAAWAKTQKQAEGLSTVIILVMSALGGAWFPIQMVDLPLAAQVVTRCTLTHWAMSSYQGMLWHAKPWTDASMLTSIGVLVAFGALALTTAHVLFVKRYVRAA
ncbi:MAG: ABC transporter permease [Planctomycetes bacterium]|nr:ABC transporter permease [Planctomycetota bacterium]MCC7173063.1 ABC transporter permease [Planctomycetota bacterium]